MIIKISSSGKQLQVIDDAGVVFGTSVEFVKGLLDGRSPAGFVLMTRMPWKVAANRYKPSPVYVPLDGSKELFVDDSSTTGDAQSVKVLQSSREVEMFKDKVVF